MPKPKQIDGRNVHDRYPLDAAGRPLPGGYRRHAGALPRAAWRVYTTQFVEWKTASQTTKQQQSAVAEAFLNEPLAPGVKAVWATCRCPTCGGGSRRRPAIRLCADHKMAGQGFSGNRSVWPDDRDWTRAAGLKGCTLHGLRKTLGKCVADPEP